MQKWQNKQSNSWFLPNSQVQNSHSWTRPSTTDITELEGIERNRKPRGFNSERPCALPVSNQLIWQYQMRHQQCIAIFADEWTYETSTYLGESRPRKPSKIPVRRKRMSTTPMVPRVEVSRNAIIRILLLLTPDRKKKKLRNKLVHKEYENCNRFDSNIPRTRR